MTWAQKMAAQQQAEASVTIAGGVEGKRLDRYDLFGPHGNWAVFVVSEDGLFFAQSDFGDYAYRWDSHGCESLKHFLVGLLAQIEAGYVDGYLADKLSGGQEEFKEDDTRRELKKRIVAARREHELDKGEAREAWEELDEVLTADSSIDGYYERFHNSERLIELYGRDHHAIPCVTGRPSRVLRFIECCFVPFARELRRELGGVAP